MRPRSPAAVEEPEATAKQETIWCAVYTRKSTDENLNSDFTSLDAQRGYCENYVNAKGGMGWKVYPEQYNDAGFSGGNMDRPAIQRLLNDARDGKFQIVVAYKYDRLTRNTKDFLNLLEIFQKYKVTFASVTQNIDTSSSMGRLMQSILIDFAQFEREMISERTRDKMAAMAMKGKRVGGGPMLGYDIDQKTKKMSVNEAEAKITVCIFDTYLQEKSLSVTAKQMNNRGYRLKKWITRKGDERGGGKFNKTNLSFMLRNPLFLGKIRYKGKLYDAEHSGIIEEATFKRVQELLMKNCEQNKSDNKDKYDFLLRGLVECAVCKSVMTPNFVYSRLGKKYFYYKCTSVNNLDKTACSVGSVPAKALEQFVVEQLEKVCQEKEVIDQAVEEAKSTSIDQLPGRRQEREELSAELAKIEAEGKNLTAIWGQEGPNSPRKDFLMERIATLGEQRKQIETQLMRVNIDISNLEIRECDAQIVQNGLRNFLLVFKGLTPKEQKEFIRLLIKEVIYDGAKGEITIGFFVLPAKKWPMEAYGSHFDAGMKTLPD